MVFPGVMGVLLRCVSGWLFRGGALGVALACFVLEWKSFLMVLSLDVFSLGCSLHTGRIHSPEWKPLVFPAVGRGGFRVLGRYLVICRRAAYSLVAYTHGAATSFNYCLAKGGAGFLTTRG